MEIANFKASLALVPTGIGEGEGAAVWPQGQQAAFPQTEHEHDRLLEASWCGYNLKIFTCDARTPIEDQKQPP